jgi:hypothetical protein
MTTIEKNVFRQESRDSIGDDDDGEPPVDAATARDAMVKRKKDAWQQPRRGLPGGLGARTRDGLQAATRAAAGAPASSVESEPNAGQARDAMIKRRTQGSRR